MSSAESKIVPLMEDLVSLLDKFHASAAIGDFDEYFACFHPNGRFLGTDKTENWVVPDFMVFSRPHFTLGTSAWTFVPIPESRKCDCYNGSHTTFATFDEHLQSASFGTTARGTGSAIWNEDTGKWLITQYHLSFPIPNDLAHDMCKKIGNYEKSLGMSVGVVASDDWIDETEKRSGSGTNKKKSSNKKKK